MSLILAVLGDTHINSTTALCLPRVPLDDGGEYIASKVQRWIYRQFTDFCQKVQQEHDRLGWPVLLLHLGEIADDLNHRTTQLISKNPADMERHARLILDPLVQLCDWFIVIRGTEAHTGPSGTMDERMAADFGAIGQDDNISSWWHWIASVEGVTVDAAHHPGTGHMRPWTRGADANRVAAMVKDNYIEAGEWPPNLVLRGHNHKPTDSADNHRTTRAIILPSWQLNNAFGYRLGGGWLPIGGVLIYLDNGQYEVKKHYSSWPIRKRNYWRLPA